MGLPSGYKRLEYIESTGTQWIDTGFIPNQDTRIDIDAIPLSVAEASDGAGFIPYGAGVSNGNRAFECYSSLSQYEFNYDGQYNFVGSSAVGQRLKISHNKNNVSLIVNGGTPITLSFTYQAFTAPYTMTLFAIHRSSPLRGLMKLYSCQIYDNGTLIRDYIPCQKPDGTIGLWDDVNSVFYGNAGTGAFAAGPEIDPYGNDEHTLLLLHGENFTDSSSYRCAVTASDVTISDLAKFRKSLGFNSSATMSVVLPMNLATADFTIDWWEYRNTADADVSTIFTFGSKNVNTILGAYNESNSNIKLYASSTGSGWDVANGTIGILVKNQWVHRAIVRTGGKIYAYQDGVLQNTFSGASKIYAPDNIITFSQCFGGGYLNGYIDEFRVSDIARWTEDFTPPTEPYTSSLNLPVNIGGTWKKANEAFVNIGGTWKTVKDVFVNIGGAWKKIG